MSSYGPSGIRRKQKRQAEGKDNQYLQENALRAMDCSSLNLAADESQTTKPKIHQFRRGSVINLTLKRPHIKKMRLFEKPLISVLLSRP